MYGYIYLTTNLINGKKYVGMHKSSKFDPNYKGSGKILRQAFAKHGWDNFKVEILVECETPEELSQQEFEEIERRHAVESSDYYNIKQGGFGGFKINGVSIKKGVKISEQARRNTSLAHLGVKLSESHRRSLSECRKGDRNPLRGPNAEQARHNLSLAMKGNQNGKGHIWITDGVHNQRILEGQETPSRVSEGSK